MSEPNTDRKPIAFRGGGFAPTPRRAVPWIVFAALIGLWQAASSSGLLPPLFMPSPAAIVRALYGLWLDGTLVEHVTASLKRIVPGWIIGTAAGLAVGPRHGHLLGGARGRPADRVGAVSRSPRSRCCRC